MARTNCVLLEVEASVAVSQLLFDCTRLTTNGSFIRLRAWEGDRSPRREFSSRSPRRKVSRNVPTPPPRGTVVSGSCMAHGIVALAPDPRATVILLATPLD